MYKWSEVDNKFMRVRVAKMLKITNNNVITAYETKCIENAQKFIYLCWKCVSFHTMLTTKLIM